MNRKNRDWLPVYCNPDAHLPKIPETRALFKWRPYLIQDFVGKAITYLESDEIKKVGLEYDYRRVVPSRWKCSDESLFGVDLAIFAHTRAFPFDKGMIGGRFNPGSLGAAVHHGSINVDIGGSHVGYVPGEGGGCFGRIWRPATQEYSTDCGYLASVLEPFQRVYRDACNNILVAKPEGERVLVSVPNEYVQPSWSSERIKLLVDLETLSVGEVEYDPGQPLSETLVGRSVFYLNPQFLDELDPEDVKRLCTPKPRRVGHRLTHRYFNIWDSEAVLVDGLPKERLLLYMKFILSARHSPDALKAAVVSAAIEHNRLTDAIRDSAYRDIDFVSVSGVFIDLYSQRSRSYVNLFQPIGMTIKPRGRSREREFTPSQIHEIFERMPAAEPAMPIEGVFGHARPEHVLENFTFEPGNFTREPNPA